MLARKAVTRASLVPPQKGGTLRPQATGGKLFLPGFHRTRQESAAAAIIIDAAKPGKTGLYGPGFYMTRTYKNQTRKKMISNYGKHLVRCRVDVSRFICFDRAAAKRVWGVRHSLAEQLAEYGPWEKDQQAKIDVWSKALSAFWDNKKSKDAVYETGFYSPHIKRTTKYNKAARQIENSADIARLASQDLRIQDKVPGIMYTGASDGACVLAYTTDRVRPLTTALVPKENTAAGSVLWISATDRRIKRLHMPEEALKDDIKTYTQRLTMVGQKMTTAQKIALIEDSYKQLPDDGHDRVAFCVSLLRVCKRVDLHEVRDNILAEFAESITKLLNIDMPCFIVGNVNGRSSSKSTWSHKELRVHLFHHSDLDDEDDDNDYEDKIKAARRYLSFLKRYSVLWDFIRYQVFLTVANQHRVSLKEALDSFMGAHPNLVTNYKWHERLGGVFGGHISKYGDVKMTNHASKYSTAQKIDGILYLQEVLDGLRDDSGYKRDSPSTVSRYTSRQIVYNLIGKDEYVQFMRSQILKFYHALKKHPVIGQHPPIKKILNAWYRAYGKHHKQAVAAYKAFDLIGGQTLEPAP